MAEHDPIEDLIKERQAEGIARRDAVFAPFERRRKAPTLTNRLLTILQGAAAGVRAGQEAKDPLSALILGASSGAQVPQAMEAQETQRRRSEAQTRMEELEITPIEAVSPQLVETFKKLHGVDLRGVPAGLVNKYAPLLEDKFTQKLALASMQNQMRDTDRLLTKEEISFVESQRPELKGRLGNIRASLLQSILPQNVINPITGESVQAPKGTRFLAPPGAARAQEGISGLNQFLQTLNLAETALTKVPAGRIGGSLTDFTNRLTGAFPEAAEARSLLNAMPSLAARILSGEVGNLNEQEQARAAQLIPKLSGTATERANSLRNLKTLLQSAVARQQKIVRGGMGGQDQTGEQSLSGDEQANKIKRAYQDGVISKEDARKKLKDLGYGK